MLHLSTKPVDPISPQLEKGFFIKTIHLLSVISGAVSAAMIVASVVITCQMIFVRFVLNESTIWQTESVVYLMTSATLLGLPYVQLLRGHVNVDLIPLLLRPKSRKVLKLFSILMTIVIISLLAFYSFEFFHIAWEKNWKSDTIWGVRMWIPYIALPIGFTLFLLQMVADFIEAWNEPETESELAKTADESVAIKKVSH